MNSTDSLRRWGMLPVILLLFVVGFQSFWIYRLSISPGNTHKETQQENTVPTTPKWNDAQLDPLNQFDPNRWDPFAEMQHMRERMDQMFGEAFGRFENSTQFDSLFDTPFSQSPRVNMSETEDAYIVSVDLPGADNSKIETLLEDQVLTIRAEIDLQQEKDRTAAGEHFLYKERRTGSFERSIMIPEPVEVQDMTSEFEDGVLRIRIPKKYEAS